MKKLFFLAFMLLSAVAANAQEGRFYLGGSLGFWSDSDADETTITIAPELGYNLSDVWAVGASLQFSRVDVDDYSVNIYGLEPYARFTYFETGALRLFLDGQIGIASIKPEHGDSSTMFELGIAPGLMFSLSDNFSLVGKLGFVGFRDVDKAYSSVMKNGWGIDLSGNNIELGVIYSF